MKNFFRIYKNKTIFLLIILIALILRFYNLTNVPPSASLDEANIGYNAYSILKTGADEYGDKFPVLLRAYDDWRPALYVYLVVPFIKLFGLNVLAVRLPSVILSLLTVIATYLLTKELFKNSKSEYRNSKQIQNSNDRNLSLLEIGNCPAAAGSRPWREKLEIIPLFSMLFLAISPWHIYISRLGHEVNAGLSFFVFALLFFFKDKIFLSLLFFTLSFISYQSEKVFIPLFVSLLFLLYWKNILEHKRELIISSIFCLIIVVPFIQATLSPQALIRLEATNVFNSQDERFFNQSKVFAQALEENDLIGRIIYNRRLLYPQIFLEGYFSHFNPTWLFTNPLEDRHKVPGLGLFYPWEAILLIVGSLFLFFKKFDKRIKLVIVAWIALSIIPSAFTTDSPHAMRTFTALPAPQIISSLGLVYIFSFIKQKKTTDLLLLFFSILVIISIVYFSNQYFSIFPKTQSSSFQYSLSQAIKYVANNEHKYDKVAFSNKDNLYQSYMFFLFTTKYEPQKYQELGGTISGGYDKTHRIGKFEFRPVDWKREIKDNNTLYIGNIDEFAPDAKIINRFYNLDGKETIDIAN